MVEIGVSDRSEQVGRLEDQRHGRGKIYLDHSSCLRSPSFKQPIQLLPICRHAPFLVFPLGVLGVHGGYVYNLAVFDW